MQSLRDLLGLLWVGPLYFSKPEQPPQPDYVGAAQAQGSANKETAIATAKLNNPWTQNALGSRQVDYSGAITGDPLVPYVKDLLTPEGERRQAQEGRIIGNLGNVAEAGLYRVGDAFSQPMQYGDINALQDAAVEAQMSRLRPLFDTREEQLRTRLSNQGIKDVGSQAYQNEMRTFNQGRNDAESQAILHAIGLQPQLMQQELAIRNQPLNELNALRTGSQVSMPQFQGYQGSQVGQTPYAQAINQAGQYQGDLFNQRVGTYNANMGGLYGLGAGLGAGLLALSDARAKENVEFLGMIGPHRVYSFNYIGGEQMHIGVLAQEAEQITPDAVLEMDGLKYVDYGKLWH